MFTRVTVDPERPNESRQESLHRRRSPYAAPVAILLSAAIVLLGVPVGAMADEPVPAGDVTTPTAEPASDPDQAGEPTPDPGTEPTADPSAGVAAPEPESAAVPPADGSAVEPATEDGAGDDSDTESADADASVPPAAAAKLAPAVVAAAAPVGQTTIRVTKGGDRQIDGSISPLAGVRFIAIDADYDDALANSPDLADEPAVADCVTDATGTCEMTVEDRNAGPNDGYWILEAPTAAVPLPDGYNALASYGLGDYTAPKVVTQHRYHSGPVSGIADIRNIPNGIGVRPPFGINTEGGNGPAWANAYDNPGYPRLCGAQIAIVVDRSASINTGEMSSFRTAVQSFVGVDGLGPTPSTADVYSFATTAAKVTASPVAIGSGDLAAAVSAATAGEGGGFTNWDAALRLVLAAPVQYDLVIVLTDGDPTTYGSGAVQNPDVPVRMLEEAVASANAVKKKGGPHADLTKIVGVGVGMTTNSNLNLRAITGPVLNDDYYLADSFAALRGKLREVATDACGGTLTVTKQIVSEAGAVIDDSAENWGFTAEGALENEAGDPVSSLSATTGADGKVNYAVDFQTSTASKTITVTEAAQPGYLLHQQGGLNAACTVDGSPLEATDVGPLGFSVTVGLNQIVSCVVQNQPIANITHEKTVTSIEQEADGTWTVVYDVTVTNSAPGSTGTYDLADTLDYGDGLDVLSASATGPDGAIPGWPDSDVLADDVVIGDTPHVYTITVNASVAEGVIGTPAAECDAPPTEGGSGFLNRALLTVAGTTTEKDACAEPVQPTLQKQFVSATRLLDDSWDVTFNLVVANEHDIDLAYSLRETPGFPVGAVFNSFSVTPAAGTPAPATTGGSNPLPFFVVQTDQTIAAGATHTYTVVMNASVNIPPAQRDERLCTLTETPGRGFFNAAVLTAGNDRITRFACGEIPEFDIGIVKSLADGQPPVEGGDEFPYTLTVTNDGSGPVTGVTVTDTLDPQLELVDPTGGGIVVAPVGALLVSVDGNELTFEGAGPFAPGVIATITIPVRMLQPGPVTLPPVVGPNDPAPPRPSVNMADILNKACVDMDQTDSNPANDCSEVVIPTKRINANSYVRCINDVPWLYYAIAVTPSVPGGPITVTWVSADDGVHPVQTETRTVAFGELTGRMLWPGAAVDANGIPTAYPGYRPLLPTDDPNSPLRFENLILDETLPSYAWRNQTIPAAITFQINPEQTVLAAYPLALPTCAITPTTTSTPAGLSSTGFDDGWALWLGGGLIALGMMLSIGLWLRRRRTDEA